MRRAYLLAGSGVVAVGIAMVGSSSTPPPTPDTRIAGAPLQPADEVAAFANLAIRAEIPASEPGRVPTRAPRQTTIDGPAPTIDLASIRLEDDRYTAKLSDGSHATLTIDPGLQKLAEKLLAESRAPRGAIVAMAPDGRILALAGRRTESPEGGIEGTPDLSLATSPWAPAASVFKLVTASALLEAGVSPDDKICFHGGIRSVLASNLTDSKRDSRCETLGFGVAHSNNAILGKLAFQKLEPSKLAKTASKFGWTSALGELAGNVGAIEMPPARDLDFAKVAAGFTAESGGAKLSAVGGAMVAATFAGDGKQPTPTLIASIEGTPIPTPASHRVISTSHAREVAKMMMATCEDGSAAKSFGRGLKQKVAGKTGTLAKKEPFFMEHSWFVGFAPVEQPQIIVSVLFGNPESWHLRGQEAARRLIDHATRREKDRKRTKPRS
jgi:peptidoglycan glycosyltransferase